MVKEIKKNTQEYIVKQIIDRRDERQQNGRTITFYKIWWEGYPQSEATWEKGRKLYQYEETNKQIKRFNESWKTKKKNKEEPEEKNNTILTPAKQVKPPILALGEVKKNASIEKIIEELPIMRSKSQITEPSDNVVTKDIKGTKDFKSKIKATIVKNTKKNDEVVTKILEKFRKNISEVKQPTITNQKDTALKQVKQKIATQKLTRAQEKNKKIVSEMKQKMTRLRESKKIPLESEQKVIKLKRLKKLTKQSRQGQTQKPQQEPKQQTTRQVATSKPQISLSKPIIATIEKSKAIVTENESDAQFDRPSCLTHITEQALFQKDPEVNQIGKPLGKPTGKPNDQNGSNSEKIKLQLAQELTENQERVIGTLKNLRGSTLELIGNSTLDGQFDIKGMILCHGEYYYLTEEFGKSKILSRAQILNDHPYELICFYEKRINIKPAQISLIAI